MDTGEHEFLIACLNQLMRLGHDRFRVTAARQPARPGNDAEGAEIVAAVLNLHERPRPVGKTRHIQFLELAGLHNIAYSVDRLA
ncbi:hypothetical protein D3C73_1505740 [compost metagenome]